MVSVVLLIELGVLFVVDLTILDKKELIREFDVLISEIDKGDKETNSYREKIKLLEKTISDIGEKVKLDLAFKQRIAKLDKKIKRLDKINNILEKISNFLCTIMVHIGFWIFVGCGFILLGFIVYWIFTLNFLPLIISGIIIFFIFKNNILDKLFYSFLDVINWILGIELLRRQKAKINQKEMAIYEEVRLAIEEHPEINEIKLEINSYNQKINDIYWNFQDFRSKRNNLPSKYYGCEHILRGYLQNGLADDLKEALLRLEEDSFRNNMLDNQENLKSQMNNMRNRLAQQSNRLAQQSNQLAQQSNEISYQSNEIARLSSEVSSMR